MNDALCMLVVTGIVLLASTTLAQQIWREREDGAVRPYPGALAENWHVPGDGLLDAITRAPTPGVRSAAR